MIVIDTSIVIKWLFKNEEDAAAALDLYEKHVKEVGEIIAPQLLFYEVANVLVTKSKTSQRAIKSSMNFLYEANLISYQEKHNEYVEHMVWII